MSGGSCELSYLAALSGVEEPVACLVLLRHMLGAGPAPTPLCRTHIAQVPSALSGEGTCLFVLFALYEEAKYGGEKLWPELTSHGWLRPNRNAESTWFPV